MSRQPIDKALGQRFPTSRQVVWNTIRAQRDGFTRRNLTDVTDMNHGTVKSYLQGLELAGYIELIGLVPVGPGTTAKQWRLVRDVGAEAPRVTPEGKPVLQGLPREQMWRTMKMLGDFTVAELAVTASTDEAPVDPADARDYCRNLALAGYLVTLHKSKGGGAGKALPPTRYRFNRAKNTGPKPPMVQRMSTVFDPNLGRIVWHPEVDA